MIHRILFRTLACICLLSIVGNIQVQVHAQSTQPTIKTLIVGVAGTEPFVQIEDNSNSPDGIAIEIWEDLANKMRWLYEYKTFETVNDALKALENGELDLVVGPISITSQRVSKFRFSQPFYQSSLSIVSRAESPSIWNRISPFFSFKLLIAVGVFLVILAFVGMLLWLAERKQSPDQFPSTPLSGILNGMWLAIVTMSTTGYGDKAPITFWGRIIAGTWMVVSIIFATSMVAGIASTLTLSGLGSTTITNIEQLKGKNTATILGSPSEVFLKERHVSVVTVNELDEAFAKLDSREVDAIVYDRPQLLFYLKSNGNNALHLAKAEYYKQGYGFAFPLNTDLVYDANRALLELSEDNIVERVTGYYLGRER